MRSRTLSRALGTTSVLLLVLVTASDWPTAWLTSFWAEHAMLTNLVSSMIFLLLGATLVQRWMTQQENQKFAVVESSAFSSVAQAPLAARRALWFLLNGGLDEAANTAVATPEQEARVLGALSRHGFSVVKERDVATRNCDLPGDIDRLLVLLYDKDWVAVAHPVIRKAHSRLRTTMAEWAQLLITSKRSTQFLHELAAVAVDIGTLRALLSPIYHNERAIDHSDAIQIACAWRKAFVNTSVVFEDFMLSTESPGFARWSLRLVQPEDRRLLEASGIERTRLSRTSGRVYGGDTEPTLKSTIP